LTLKMLYSIAWFDSSVRRVYSGAGQMRVAVTCASA
jgi:hypothetical protein